MTGSAGEPVLQRDVTIVNVQGLHARAAKQFVETARRFEAHITVAKGRQIVDAKDIWDVMTLAAERGTALVLRGRGADAEEALDALDALIKAKFHEEQ